MRVYDKQGNTHLTRIRAMGANISHKLHANNRAHDSGKVGRYVEEGLDKIAESIDQANSLTDTEINDIVSSMMRDLNDPIQSFIKGELNSELGEKSFIEAVIKVINIHQMNHVWRISYSYDRIVSAYAERIVKIVGLRRRYVDTDSVG